MSTARCPVIRIENIQKHPNADTLSITEVEGCPVVFRTADFTTGQLAVYIPVDSVVDLDRPQFSFLKKASQGSTEKTTHRVRALKMRGVFSMGMLIPIPEGLQIKEGEDLSLALGVVKYEEPPTPVRLGSSNAAPTPYLAPNPYELESLRRFEHVLVPGETVVIQEKIHGCNARFLMDRDGRLHVGSHRVWLQEGSCVWWRAAKEYALTNKVRPETLVYAEVYGDVQDLKYGVGRGVIKLAVFDVFEIQTRRYWTHAELNTWCGEVGLDIVPTLYHGAYTPEIVRSLAQGNSVVRGAENQIKEGVVVKTDPARTNFEIGRVALKLHSEAYLTRKDGTEHH